MCHTALRIKKTLLRQNPHQKGMHLHCQYCNADIKISSRGRSALAEHGETPKHKSSFKFSSQPSVNTMFARKTQDDEKRRKMENLDNLIDAVFNHCENGLIDLKILRSILKLIISQLKIHEITDLKKRMVFIEEECDRLDTLERGREKELRNKVNIVDCEVIIRKFIEEKRNIVVRIAVLDQQIKEVCRKINDELQTKLSILQNLIELRNIIATVEKRIKRLELKVPKTMEATASATTTRCLCCSRPARQFAESLFRSSPGNYKK